MTISRRKINRTFVKCGELVFRRFEHPLSDKEARNLESWCSSFLDSEEEQFLNRLEGDLSDAAHHKGVEGPFKDLSELDEFLRSNPTPREFFAWTHESGVVHRRVTIYCRGQAWQLLGCHRIAQHLFLSARRTGGKHPREIEEVRDLFIRTWRVGGTMRMSESRAQLDKARPIKRESNHSEQVKRRRALVIILMEMLSGGERKSRRGWQETERKTYPWRNEPGKTEPLSYADLDTGLRDRGADYLKTVGIDLSQVNGRWLDACLRTTGMHSPCNEMEASLLIKFDVSHLGRDFPLAPALDREGFAVTSPQSPLLRQLADSWKSVIESADQFVRLDPLPRTQFSILMDMCNSVTSLMDATLIQAYYKAKYDGARAGLFFDEFSMGSSVARSFDEKLAWLDLIKGTPFQKGQDELSSFNKIRKIRNHLAHFDPPFFAFTVDDLSEWLNCIGWIGLLFVKIRLHLGCCLPDELLSLVLLPHVTTNILNREDGYYPQLREAGYGSVSWPRAARSSSVGRLQASSEQQQKITEVLARIDGRYPGERTLEDVWNACVSIGLGELQNSEPTTLIEMTRSARGTSKGRPEKKPRPHSTTRKKRTKRQKPRRK